MKTENPTDRDISDLLNAIATAVCDERNRRHKRAAILAECTENDRANLEEFASWFETDMSD